MTLRFRTLFGLGWGLVVATTVPGKVEAERIERLFRPFLADQIAMSPDGRYVAATRQAGKELTVEIMDLETLRRAARLAVDEDRTLLHSKEGEHARLRFLRWATPTRVVFAPTVHIIPPAVAILAAVPGEPPPPPLEPTIIAPVMAVDATGTNPRTLVDAETFGVDVGSISHARLRGRAPEILGFAPGDRDHVLVRVSGVRRPVTPAEVFRVNVHTGAHTSVSSEVEAAAALQDPMGKTRLIMESGRSLQRTFLYQPPGTSRWRKLHEAAKTGVAPRFALSPENYFGERALPLAMDYGGDVLIYAANIGRDAYGVYGLNLATLERTDLSVEHPRRDLASLDVVLPSPGVVFDQWRKKVAGVRTAAGRPLTLWLDAELATVQRALEEKFPGRSVQVIDWSEARRHFLVRVTGGTEPGRYFVWRKDENLAQEIFRRAPWLPNAELHATRYFEFPGSDGAELSGYLTWPRTPRLNPPPLVVVFAGGFPPQPHGEFDAEAQVLADMGFAVLRLNQRGVTGHGAKQRDAARSAVDRAAAQDAMAAVEWLAQRHPIDRKRIATMGWGFGGYLALRAAQLEPEVFRCAVATEPPVSLAAWVQPRADFNAPLPTFQQEVTRKFLEHGAAKLGDMAVTAHPDTLGAPMFLLCRTHRADTIAEGVSHLRGQLKRRGVAHEVLAIDDDFVLGRPAARTRAYRALEEFFNLNLYSPNVKIGPTRVVR